MNRKKTLTEAYSLALIMSSLTAVCFALLFSISCFHRLPRAVQIISIAAVPVCAASVLVSCILLHKKEAYYRRLCREFRDGTIYQDFIHEIGGLTPSLNEAVFRLDDLINRQEILNLSKKQAEFLALQNQINPHFLYNTLDSIRSDALTAGCANIANITESLSLFFRYTITETRNLVTIREELHNVERYFIIQQYRFGEKLSMKTELLDDETKLMPLQCPKLLLQPIIENAIFHGIEHRSEKGLVTIRMDLVDSELHIEVSDNGIGMSEEQLIDLNRSLSRVSVGAITEDKRSQAGGIALKNVCRRIKLLFGEQYGIHVGSVAGLGTTVEITLPAVEKRGVYAE